MVRVLGLEPGEVWWDSMRCGVLELLNQEI